MLKLDKYTQWSNLLNEITYRRLRDSNATHIENLENGVSTRFAYLKYIVPQNDCSMDAAIMVLVASVARSEPRNHPTRNIANRVDPHRRGG